jgi:hypothetical protein
MNSEAHTFVTAARAMKGTRWRHRGRKPWAVDCVGLIVLAAKAAGRQLDDEPIYGREPWDDQLRKGLRRRFGDPLSAGEPRECGDIALIRWHQGEPSHVAIIGDHPEGGLSLIHAHNIHGVVECALSGPYESCVIEVYRPWRDKFSP